MLYKLILWTFKKTHESGNIFYALLALALLTLYLEIWDAIVKIVRYMLKANPENKQ